MKRAYILIGAVAYSLLGCHGAKNKHFPGNDPLTKTQSAEIQAINLAQGLTLNAARGAFTATIAADTDDAPKTPEEKAQALIKMMKTGGCTQNAQKPSDTYSSSWQSAWSVSGGTCPMALVEGQEFSVKDKTYSLKRSISLTPEFQAVSGLSAHSVHGSLQQSLGTGSKRAIVGEFHYDEFTVAGIGAVRADVFVRPVGVEGGWIQMKLQTPDSVADVLVRWDMKSSSYIVNGTQMELKDFQTLFSSFELVELLDRVKRMM